MDLPRIVSLCPCGTEIVCALGFSECLVGRSHECDYPDTVTGLRPCTAPRQQRSVSAADGSAEDYLKEYLCEHSVDIDSIKQARPALIITSQDGHNVQDRREKLDTALASVFGSDRPRLISLDPRDLSGVLGSIDRVAQAMFRPERGVDLIRKLRSRISNVERRVRTLSVMPRVACIAGLDPLTVAGGWVPEMVLMAGGVCRLNQAGAPSKHIDWDMFFADDPEVVVVMDLAGGFSNAKGIIERLAAEPRWHSLKAAQRNKVCVVDGRVYFNRPGPRLTDSLELLAEMLHPEVFGSAHKGRDWAAY